MRNTYKFIIDTYSYWTPFTHWADTACAPIISGTEHSNEQNRQTSCSPGTKLYRAQSGPGVSGSWRVNTLPPTSLGHKIWGKPLSRQRVQVWVYKTACLLLTDAGTTQSSHAQVPSLDIILSLLSNKSLPAQQLAQETIRGQTSLSFPTSLPSSGQYGHSVINMIRNNNGDDNSSLLTFTTCFLLCQVCPYISPFSRREN